MRGTAQRVSLLELAASQPGATDDGKTWAFACPLPDSEGRVGKHTARVDRSGVACDGGHNPYEIRHQMEQWAEYLAMDASGPPTCLIPHKFDDRNQCLACVTRREWVTETVRARREELSSAGDSMMRVSGAELFDMPPVAPIWGTPAALLAAEGQGWMIAGPDGTGKTSTAAQYVKARLGLAGWSGDMWGLPVQPLPADRGVYYLGADRPRQMMEAFMRGIVEEHRAELTRRLFVHKGPPPYRLSRERGQRWLLDEIEHTRAALVVLDSRKDFGSTVDAIEVAGVQTAVQLLTASDIEVLILAHPVKSRRNGPPSLEDVSGLRDVFSGLGSVIFLNGQPGSPQIEVHQVKPIREVVLPFTIRHDHAAGRSDRVGAPVVAPTNATVWLDTMRIKVIGAIDAHPGGEALAQSLKSVLNTDNLNRTLKPLLDEGSVVHNGARGPQSGYRRGPNAPPKP